MTIAEELGIPPIADVVRVVRESAEKYPDAVYHRRGGVCQYAEGSIDNGPPDFCGCIIGYSFHLLGFDPAKIDRYNRFGGESAGVPSAAEIWDDSDDRENWPKELNFLSDVQCLQDQGSAWGDAVTESEHFLDN